MPLDPTLGAVAAVVLAAVFAVAGVAKLRAPDAFAGVVANYRLLPDRLVRPVAWLLPPLEVALALCVLLPVTRVPAAAALCVLLLLFAGAMAVNLRRGRTGIDCGCAIGLLKERIS